MTDQLLKKHMMDEAAPSTTSNNMNSKQMKAGEDSNLSLQTTNETLTKNKKLIDDIINHAPTPTQPSNMEEYWEYCSHCNENNENNNKTTLNNNNNNKPQLKMDMLLCQSRDMLAKYFNANFIRQQGIPYYIFNEAKGVIFLSYWKAGLVIGAAYGTGIMLSKLENKWSGPCAISLGSCEIGLDIGVEKVDYILVVNDTSIFNFFENNGVFTIGADAGIALGPYGKDINMLTEAANNRIFSYCFAKGGYIGIGLESGVITIAKNWNEEYYGKPVTVNEILANKVEIPQNERYLSLINVINQYNLKSEHIGNVSMDPIVVHDKDKDTKKENEKINEDRIKDRQ